MKHFITIVLALLLLTSCSEEKKSATSETATEAVATDTVDNSKPALAEVERLYSEGRYRECCEAIKALRSNHPGAIEARKRCLELWDEAQLAIAKEDLATAQTRLPEAERELKNATNQTRKNLLDVEIDDLRARIEAQQQIVNALTEKIENRIAR